MAERSRAGAQTAAVCPELAPLQRRRALEDIPMCRVRCRERSGQVSASACGWSCGGVARLLEEQNQLLCEILGAVNALTAAQLALGRQE